MNHAAHHAPLLYCNVNLGQGNDDSHGRMTSRRNQGGLFREFCRFDWTVSACAVHAIPQTCRRSSTRRMTTFRFAVFWSFDDLRHGLVPCLCLFVSEGKRRMFLLPTFDYFDARFSLDNATKFGRFGELWRCAGKSHNKAPHCLNPDAAPRIVVASLRLFSRE